MPLRCNPCHFLLVPDAWEVLGVAVSTGDLAVPAGGDQGLVLLVPSLGEVVDVGRARHPDAGENVPVGGGQGLEGVLG